MAVCSHIQVSNNYPVIRMATVISDNTLKWEAKTMNGAYKNYVEAEIPPMDSARRDVESIKTYPEKKWWYSRTDGFPQIKRWGEQTKLWRFGEAPCTTITG